jgi:hypothetical protein
MLLGTGNCQLARIAPSFGRVEPRLSVGFDPPLNSGCTGNRPVPFWNMQGDVMIDAAAGEFVRKFNWGYPRVWLCPRNRREGTRA